MIRDILNNLTITRGLTFTAATILTLTGNLALANIANPEASQGGISPSPALSKAALVETREILDRASFIAFEGAEAVQKMQTLSVDSATSELLKNYMATMVYVPKAMALPSDEEALDEPWLANSNGTTTEDGLVIPSMAGLTDELDEDTPAKKFLRLLQPVKNALVTSGFGFRWGRPHQGIDMAAPLGTPIVSAESGKVIYSGWKSGYGKFVAIDHGHGYQTHYAHCSSLNVQTGQTVHKGQMIAKVGSTGHSTGPHLHFEVIANGVHRNPANFLNRPLSIVQNR